MHVISEALLAAEAAAEQRAAASALEEAAAAQAAVVAAQAALVGERAAAAAASATAREAGAAQLALLEQGHSAALEGLRGELEEARHAAATATSAAAAATAREAALAQELRAVQAVLAERTAEAHSASASAAATASALSSALEEARGEAAALGARLGVAEAALSGTGERERESVQAAAAAAARAEVAEERARAAEAAVVGAEDRAAAAALAVRAAQEGAAAAAAAERAQLQSQVESLRREIAALTSANATSAAAAPAPQMRLEVPTIPEAALLTPTGQPFLVALQATPDAHKLGKGNTGTVRSALWLRGGVPGGSVQVAVKTVLLDADVGTDDEASYRREAAVQADLSHPHIAAVHGVLHSPVGARRALHTVMELGSGGGLDALVKPGGALHSGSATLPLGSPARLARVAHLGAQAALGLLQAHARGYAHCDVKLANLILGSSGRLLVADFGIAFRVRQGGRPLAPAGTLPGLRDQVLGTLGYTAPENFQDCAHIGQPPCDVYSLAFVLLELAQGELLPEPPRMLDALDALPPLGSELAALGISCRGINLRPQLPEAVDPRLAALIQACWAADPRARPTMAEVARQLLDMAQ